MRTRGGIMSDQLSLTVDPLGDAVSWRRLNPDAYAALVRWCREEIAAGGRPSIDAYGHVLRHPYIARHLGLVRMAGDPVLFNNNLTSGLARLLKRDEGLEIPTRAARVDGWQEAS